MSIWIHAAKWMAVGLGCVGEVAGIAGFFGNISDYFERSEWEYGIGALVSLLLAYGSLVLIIWGWY